jgi:molybdenum cofactor biosynthesis enzyme MoaA
MSRHARGITLSTERGDSRGEIGESDATWYLTVDIQITEYTRVIRDLTIGVEDVMVTAVGEPTLRQELRYLRDRIEELRGRQKTFRRCYRRKVGT